MNDKNNNNDDNKSYIDRSMYGLMLNSPDNDKHDDDDDADE